MVRCNSSGSRQQEISTTAKYRNSGAHLPLSFRVAQATQALRWVIDVLEGRSFSMGIDVAAFTEFSAQESSSINEHLRQQGFAVPDTSYEDDPLAFLLHMVRFYQKVQAFVIDDCILQ